MCEALAHDLVVPVPVPYLACLDSPSFVSPVIVTMVMDGWMDWSRGNVRRDTGYVVEVDSRRVEASDGVGPFRPR